MPRWTTTRRRTEAAFGGKCFGISSMAVAARGQSAWLLDWAGGATLPTHAVEPQHRIKKRWARSRAPMLRSIRTAASKQRHLLSRLLAPAAPWPLLFAETRTSAQSKSARARAPPLHLTHPQNHMKIKYSKRKKKTRRRAGIRGQGSWMRRLLCPLQPESVEGSVASLGHRLRPVRARVQKKSVEGGKNSSGENTIG